jgi:hypothetical protein
MINNFNTIKISQLPTASVVSGEHLIPVVDNFSISGSSLNQTINVGSLTEYIQENIVVNSCSFSETSSITSGLSGKITGSSGAIADYLVINVNGTQYSIPLYSVS